MNQLRLTKKVQQAASLKVEDLSAIDENGIGLGSWTVHVFNQNRYKVLIFINDLTLYSFVLIKIRKEHYKNIPKLFCAGLRQLLETDGFSKNDITHLMQGLDNLSYSKTHGKKILGTLNNLVYLYQDLIYEDGGLDYVNIGEMIHKFNRWPHKSIGYKFAIDAVIQHLKLL